MYELINVFHSILPLSSSEKEFMIKHLQTEQIRKKQVFLAYRQVCKKIAFVKKGIFRSVLLDSMGNEQIQYFISEGHFAVNIESFNEATPSEEYIEAISNAEVISFSRQDYNLMEDNIENFTKIISRLKERALVEKLKLKNDLLQDSAQEKYRKLLKQHPSIIQRVPQHHIASFLGITQYTLSRIKSYN